MLEVGLVAVVHGLHHLQLLLLLLQTVLQRAVHADLVLQVPHQAVPLLFQTLPVPLEFAVFLGDADEFRVHSLGIRRIIHRTRHLY